VQLKSGAWLNVSIAIAGADGGLLSSRPLLDDSTNSASALSSYQLLAGWPCEVDGRQCEAKSVQASASCCAAKTRREVEPQGFQVSQVRNSIFLRLDKCGPDGLVASKPHATRHTWISMQWRST